MRVVLKKIRKDGKYVVAYGFDGGRWFNKIITKDQYEHDLKDSRPVEVRPWQKGRWGDASQANRKRMGWTFYLCQQVFVPSQYPA